MSHPSRHAASITRQDPRRPQGRLASTCSLVRSLTIGSLLFSALPLAAQGPVAIWSGPRAPSHYAAGLTQQFIHIDTSLWVSDGTPAGIRQIVPTTVVRAYSGAVTLDHVGYFTGEDPRSRQSELWRTDGTAAGTYLVLDIYPGFGSNAAALAVLGNRVLFNANVSRTQRSLHITDGTAAGTTLIGPEAMRPSAGVPIVVHRGLAYFVAADTLGHGQLWKTDGTANGTALVHDIYPGGDAGLGSLTSHGDALYFTADDGVSGSELWQTDGTSAGTSLVADIRPGAIGSTPVETVSAGGLLFFSANDGVTGIELWCSDGTAAGTLRLTDEPAGSLAPRELTAFGARCVCGGSTAANGWELWISDGTIAGTGLLKDIQPGSGSSIQPQAGGPGYAAIGDRLYFSADDGVQGYQLWVSDGTTVGTTIAYPPPTGFRGASDLHVVNGKITFAGGNTASSWTTLYAWADQATVQVVGRGCGPTTRTPTIGSIGARLGAIWRISGENAYPGSVAALAVWTPAAVPIDLPLTGCSLYVEPVGLIVTPTFPITGGSWFADFVIPNSPNLNGVLLAWQAIFVGTDNPVGGVDTSPGLYMGIGN